MGFASAGVNINDVIAKDVLLRWDILNGGYIAVAGTWTKIDSTNYDMGSSISSESAQAINDEIGIGSVFIPVDGTYECHIYGHRAPDMGEAHVHLAGVDKATVDMYLASGSYNTAGSGTLGALTKGLYPVSIIMKDKNASSSAYAMSFQTLLIIKTA